METEAASYDVYTNGHGVATSATGEPTTIPAGEQVKVISIDPDTGRVLVNRTKYNSYATVSRDGLELGHFVDGPKP